MCTNCNFNHHECKCKIGYSESLTNFHKTYNDNNNTDTVNVHRTYNVHYDRHLSNQNVKSTARSIQFSSRDVESNSSERIISRTISTDNVSCIDNEEIDKILNHSHMSDFDDNSNHDSLTDEYINKRDLNLHKKGMNVISLNIQHLIPKFDELKLLFMENPEIHILALSESFLTDINGDTEFQVTGYNIERKDRISKHAGGGLLMFVRNDIPYSRIYDIENNDLESIFIEITYPRSKPYVVGLVYRPPSSNQKWIDSFKTQIGYISDKYKEFYLVGDFNLNFNPLKGFTNSKWTNFLLKVGLTQIVNTPTRVSKSSSTIIDHIYCASTDNVINVNVPGISISDHFPVCFTRKISNKYKLQANMHETIRYRSFAKFDEITFKWDIAQSGLDNINMITCDPNSYLDIFYSIFTYILNKHAPVKTKRIKRQMQPAWYNTEIKQARKQRDYFHSKNDWANYKLWRNKANALIVKSKKNYYNNAIKNKKDTKQIWKHIKAASNNEMDKGINIPPILFINDEVYTNKKNILNAFNRHFIDITRFVSRTDFCAQNFDYLKDYLDSKLKHDTFHINLITLMETKQIIDNLNTSKAQGEDGIGPSILKTCSEQIVVSITSMINNSIASGIFPDRLKHAFVLPIFKNGSKDDPNNYRPISILNTISKIFERHVANQMHKYFAKTNIIHNTQSGFRKAHSCQTALTYMIDKFMNGIDEGNLVGTVFLDLKKAFDLVDHTILIHKLKLYHFDPKAVKWFTSYLSGRKQFVKVGKEISDTLEVKSGVPQGSILGPLLFLIYINDLPLSVNKSIMDMYADDSTLYDIGKNIIDISSHLQTDINNINEWCTKNNMALNPKKTTCMLLGTNYKLKNSKPLTLTIGQENIKQVQKQKVLGLVLDHMLQWKDHIKYLSDKLCTKINLLKRISNFLSMDMKKLYYNAYILPLLDLYCTIWGTCSQTNLYKISKLQKRSARIILKVSIKTSSKTMFHKLSWINISARIQYQMGIHVYKAYYDLAPEYFCKLIYKAQSKNYKMRSNENKTLTHISKPRTEYLKRTFGYRAILIWNTIPIEIRTSETLKQFKRNYLNYQKSLS